MGRNAGSGILRTSGWAPRTSVELHGNVAGGDERGAVDQRNDGAQEAAPETPRLRLS